MPERREALKAAFEASPKLTDGRMDIKEAHALIFNAEERKEYNFDTFDEVCT